LARATSRAEAGPQGVDEPLDVLPRGVDPGPPQRNAHRVAAGRRPGARREQVGPGRGQSSTAGRRDEHPGDRLLETTDLPIGVVARHSGMVTATNLRKHFGAVVRTTPQAYRDAFRSRGDRLGRHSVG
jgi:hypothetical protein